MYVIVNTIHVGMSMILTNQRSLISGFGVSIPAADSRRGQQLFDDLLCVTTTLLGKAFPANCKMPWMRVLLENKILKASKRLH